MIEHSRDFRRINKAAEGAFPVHISPELTYLLEVHDSKDLGVWFFHPFEDGLNVHVNLSKHCRGPAAAASARNAFKWVFANTKINVIYAVIPVENQNARVLAYITGFRHIFSVDDGYKYYKLERGLNKQRMAA